MNEKKQPIYKRCPRCNTKTFYHAQVCGHCELNYEKFKLATNEEAKNALRKGEKSRVVKTNKLPSDVLKWPLFWYAFFLGWTGAHLFKVGLYKRGICHLIGLVLGAIYVVGLNFKLNAVTYNLVMWSGVFWFITFCLAVIDIFEIAFNWFKVPVSLPYKEK